VTGPETSSAGQRVARLRRVAWWLDEGIRIPGTRFRIGLDPILGLLPGIGDAVGAIMAGSVLLEAARSGVGRFTFIRMALNVGLDALLGAIPVLGDLFDAGWKANTRNLVLLERHLAEGPSARRADRRFVLVVGGAALVAAVGIMAGGAYLLLWLLRTLF
jgi:hypothetical protein